MKTMAVLAGCILAAVGVAMAGRVVQPLLTMDGVIQADTSAQADRATYADGAGTATATNLDAATRTLVAAIAGGIISTSVPPTPTSVSFATNAAWAARLGTATNWVETDSNGTWQVTVTPFYSNVYVSAVFDSSPGAADYNGPPTGTTWTGIDDHAIDMNFVTWVDSYPWRLMYNGAFDVHSINDPQLGFWSANGPFSLPGLIGAGGQSSSGSLRLDWAPLVTNRVRIATTDDFHGLPFVSTNDTRYRSALTNAAQFAPASIGTLASNALPVSGGSMAAGANITITSTSDTPDTFSGFLAGNSSGGYLFATTGTFPNQTAKLRYTVGGTHQYDITFPPNPSSDKNVLYADGSAAGLSGFPAYLVTTGQLTTATNALYIALTNWDIAQDAGFATTGTIAGLSTTQAQVVASVNAMGTTQAQVTAGLIYWSTNATAAISNTIAYSMASFDRYETNNWTPTFSMLPGQIFNVFIAHSTSNQVTTWPSGIKWQSGTTVGAVTNTTGFMDTYGFVFRPNGVTNGLLLPGVQ